MIALPNSPWRSGAGLVTRSRRGGSHAPRVPANQLTRGRTGKYSVVHMVQYGVQIAHNCT